MTLLIQTLRKKKKYICHDTINSNIEKKKEKQTFSLRKS